MSRPILQQREGVVDGNPTPGISACVRTRSRTRIADCKCVVMPIQYDSDLDDRETTDTLAIALGWFSVALGTAELFAPRQVADLIGAPPGERTTTMVRASGARELAHGMAILSRPAEARWLWSRVGGDTLDLASLGAAAGDDRSDRGRLILAAAAVAGVTALDVLAALRLSGPSNSQTEFGVIYTREQATTVKASLEEVEAAWLGWCASGESRLRNNYAVRFEPAPGARGTEIHLSGGGSSGTIRDELRRFKQRLETGEIPVSDGPGLSRPAQPRHINDMTTPAEVRR